MANAIGSPVRERDEAGRVGEDGHGESTVQSAEKALAVVEVLIREGAPLTAREIAERCGINRTTAYRFLNALMRSDWVAKQAERPAYGLSLRFLMLARLLVDQRDIVAEIRPQLEALALACRETIHLGILDGFEVVHVFKVDSPERIGISSRVGSRAVPHVTGLGKALLALSPPPFVAAYLEHARRLPAPFALRDPAPLVADLEATRRRGYSLDNEEDSIGVRCVGVAIRGVGGEPAFALSMTGPAGRITDERIAACAPLLVRAAGDISARLGWEPEGADGGAV